MLRPPGRSSNRSRTRSQETARLGTSNRKFGSGWPRVQFTRLFSPTARRRRPFPIAMLGPDPSSRSIGRAATMGRTAPSWSCTDPRRREGSRAEGRVAARRERASRILCPCRVRDVGGEGRAVEPFGIDTLYSFHRYLEYLILAVLGIHAGVFLVDDPTLLEGLVPGSFSHPLILGAGGLLGGGRAGGELGRPADSRATLGGAARAPRGARGGGGRRTAPRARLRRPHPTPLVAGVLDPVRLPALSPTAKWTRPAPRRPAVRCRRALARTDRSPRPAHPPACRSVPIPESRGPGTKGPSRGHGPGRRQRGRPGGDPRRRQR